MDGRTDPIKELFLSVKKDGEGAFTLKQLFNIYDSTTKGTTPSRREEAVREFLMTEKDHTGITILGLLKENNNQPTLNNIYQFLPEDWRGPEWATACNQELQTAYLGGASNLKDYVCRMKQTDLDRFYHLALNHDHSEAMTLCVKNGALLNPKWLLEAAKLGHFEMIKRLAHAGINVNAKYHDNDTALHFAAKRGHLEALEALLQNGADPNVINIHDESPLYLAAKKGHIAIVKKLFEAGVPYLELFTKARKKGWEEITESLVKAGANIENISDEQRLAMAIKYKADNIVRDILEKKLLKIIELNKTDENDKEPPYCGFFNKRHEVIPPTKQQIAACAEALIKVMKDKDEDPIILMQHLKALEHEELREIDQVLNGYYAREELPLAPSPKM